MVRDVVRDAVRELVRDMVRKVMKTLDEKEGAKGALTLAW